MSEQVFIVPWAVDHSAREAAGKLGHDLGRWVRPQERSTCYTARAICRHCHGEWLLAQREPGGIVAFDGGAAYHPCTEGQFTAKMRRYHGPRTIPILARARLWLRHELSKSA